MVRKLSTIARRTESRGRFLSGVQYHCPSSVATIVMSPDNHEGLELQNENDHKQGQVNLVVDKVASMAEREEANARLVGDYENTKIGMNRNNVTDFNVLNVYVPSDNRSLDLTGFHIVYMKKLLLLYV